MKEMFRLRFAMEARDETAEVMVYSEIASEKWWGDETTTGDFDKALKDARKGGATKLNIRINSGGGEVYAAVAMRSMVINAGFEHVRVMIEGLCASAATLFVTIPDAEVVIAEGSEFMIHNPMTVTWGNAEEITKTVEHLRKMEGQFRNMYMARTGQSEDTVWAWMDAETWFTAKEAVENGFCDTLLEAEPVAACVSAREMGLMRSLYAHVPEGVSVQDEGRECPIPRIVGTSQSAEGEAAGCETENRPLSYSEVSDGEPASGAGDPTEIYNHEEEDSHMDIKDISMDLLRAENPALLEQIRQEAISEERQRIEDIDALTLPGYEALAEDAKANGTSAMDFQRQVVQAQRQKGRDFLDSRRQETEPAREVLGMSAEESRSEQQKVEDAAKEIAAYAQEFSGNNNEGMF